MAPTPRVLLLLTLTVLLSSPAWSDRAASVTVNEARTWIKEMKRAPRGPFERLRWFCNDGTTHPPKPFTCVERGGGYQHGEWSDTTKRLRAAGYKVANLLAGVDAGALLSQPDFQDTLNQLLFEKFLISADDGWIFRRAMFYRGAVQEEDERAGARALLLEMLSRDEWIGVRYPALRIAARLLHHGAETASIQKVRQVSTALSELDEGFTSIRAKIHGAPGPDDAQRVRDHAATITDPELKSKYQGLATEIDGIYNISPMPVILEKLAASLSSAPELQRELRDGAHAYRAKTETEARYRITASLLALQRRALPGLEAPTRRLELLDAGLLLEADNFRLSTELRDRLPGTSRRQRLSWLAAAADAAYGTGMLNARSATETRKAIAGLEGERLPLDDYKDLLSYLGRAPTWATQGLRFQFYDSMQKLAAIEPLANLFIQDQLRGSPLLFFSQVLDTLSRDANRLAGLRHRLFGEEIGIGFRALNPGLARGVLHARADAAGTGDFSENGIYLLPETVSDLPPVAGILTAGEGNPLSHVQLLARNLGIPNVGIDEARLADIRKHDGKPVVLAVSPAGLVQMEEDGPRWDAVFGADDGGDEEVLIKPDLNKLDLSVEEFLVLDDLRADDSGRTVGPKAAKLGELRHHYPKAVARGVAIPFGMFRREVLDRPYKQTGRTLFEWMTAQYARIEQLPAGSEERRAVTEDFRAELYDRIVYTSPGPDFRERLRAVLSEVFGSGGTPGVFIRSDTNVEDLPGFTGAGLNLTLPNVVGFDRILEGIPRVWASPFTARAFAWRQSLMSDPEHVYTSILLLESVPADKSGVLVTQDIDSGKSGVLSVAVNEGVGGAVDGQAAESLRIDMSDASVKVLATATAPWRRLPAPEGGVEKLPASGKDTVLETEEIAQLIQLARELPKRFPGLIDDRDKPAPADVEFGFVDHELRLFQIRPFLESRRARGSKYLSGMDAALKDLAGRYVDMREVPGG